MRKEMHKKEKDWLKGKASVEAKSLRKEYLKVRAMYSKAVKRAKRSHLKNKQEQLEKQLCVPKKFWRTLRKINVSKAKKQGRKLLCVLDEEGVVQSGKDALAVWRNHFAKILGDDVETDQKSSCDTGCMGCKPGSLSETSPYLCEPISREAVSWALNEVRKDVAPGMDDVVMGMMVTER